MPLHAADGREEGAVTTAPSFFNVASITVDGAAPCITMHVHTDARMHQRILIV